MRSFTRLLSPLFAAAWLGVVFSATSFAAQANPVDPGVRGGSPGAGDSLPGLTPEEFNAFQIASMIFQCNLDIQVAGLLAHST